MATPTSGEEENVKVFCRVRPPSARELDSGYRACVEVDEEANCVRVATQPTPSPFTFDHVAGTETDQESVFKLVGRGVSEGCLEGYNGTIFAYGQSGSGKTYTMLGPGDGEGSDDHQRGLLPRVLDHVFAYVEREEQQSGGRLSFLLKTSFLEIYNEHIHDLLEPGTRNLQLRESLDGGVYVEGLVHETVTSATEAHANVDRGAHNRRTAFTLMNALSSRSHSVFTIHIEARDERGEVPRSRVARFHLVDLAGSERQRSTEAAGERLKEAANINKSLSALGHVINALVDRSQGRPRHIHFRDSKLTFLLRDALGGNAKTHLIATVSPAAQCFAETLSTLRFASRAKNIRVNAVVNEATHGTVAELQAEVAALRSQLACRVDGGDGVATRILTPLRPPSTPRRAGPNQDRLLADALRDAARSAADADAEARARRGFHERAQSLQRQVLTLRRLLRAREAAIARLGGKDSVHFSHPAARRWIDEEEEEDEGEDEGAKEGEPGSVIAALRAQLAAPAEAVEWRLRWEAAQERLARVDGADAPVAPLGDGDRGGGVVVSERAELRELRALHASLASRVEALSRERDAALAQAQEQADALVNAAAPASPAGDDVEDMLAGAFGDAMRGNGTPAGKAAGENGPLAQWRAEHGAEAKLRAAQEEAEEARRGEKEEGEARRRAETEAHNAKARAAEAEAVLGSVRESAAAEQARLQRQLDAAREHAASREADAAGVHDEVASLRQQVGEAEEARAAASARVEEVTAGRAKAEHEARELSARVAEAEGGRKAAEERARVEAAAAEELRASLAAATQAREEAEAAAREARESALEAGGRADRAEAAAAARAGEARTAEAALQRAQFDLGSLQDDHEVVLEELEFVRAARQEAEKGREAAVRDLEQARARLDEARGEAASEVRSAEAALDEATARAEGAERDRAAAEEALEEARSTIAAAEERASAAAAQASEAREQKQALEQRATEAEASLEELRAALAQAQAVAEEAHAELGAAERRHARALEEGVEEVRAQSERVDHAEAARQTALREVAVLRASAAASEEERERMAAELASARVEARHAAEECKARAEEVQEATVRAERAEARAQHIRSCLASLDEAADGAGEAEEVQAVQEGEARAPWQSPVAASRAGRIRSRNAQLAGELAEAKAAQASAEQEVARAREEAAEAKAEAQRLRAESATATQSWEAARGREQELERRCGEAEAAAKALRGEREQLEFEREVASAAVEDLRDRCGELEEEAYAAKKRASALEEAASASQQEREGYLQRIAALIEHEDAATKRADAVVAEAERARAATLKARREAAAATARSAEAERESERLRADNARLVGHQNPHQKIQHHVKIKQENNTLRNQLRAVQAENTALRRRAGAAAHDVPETAVHDAESGGGGAGEEGAAAAEARREAEEVKAQAEAGRRQVATALRLVLDALWSVHDGEGEGEEEEEGVSGGAAAGGEGDSENAAPGSAPPRRAREGLSKAQQQVERALASGEPEALLQGARHAASAAAEFASHCRATRTDLVAARRDERRQRDKAWQLHQQLALATEKRRTDRRSSHRSSAGSQL